LTGSFEIKGIVVDRHGFNADPNPNFYLDADPYPDLDWHQNDANPQEDPTPSLTHLRKKEKCCFSQQCQFFLSHKLQKCHYFKDNILKFSKKR
jgi:hypothetical protein